MGFELEVAPGGEMGIGIVDMVESAAVVGTVAERVVAVVVAAVATAVAERWRAVMDCRMWLEA